MARGKLSVRSVTWHYPHECRIVTYSAYNQYYEENAKSERVFITSRFSPVQNPPLSTVCLNIVVFLQIVYFRCIHYRLPFLTSSHTN